MQPLAKSPARSLVVTPRMPAFPKLPYAPFASGADVVAECETCLSSGGRRYHVMGPRPDVKKALDEHHRQYHPEETTVVLLNHPRQ